MATQNQEDHEHAMDLFFHDLDSSHEYTREATRRRREEQAGANDPTTDRSES